MRSGASGTDERCRELCSARRSRAVMAIDVVSRSIVDIPCVCVDPI